MNLCLTVSVFCWAILTVSCKDFDILYTTAERIESFNYPVESQNVLTSDGYNLTLFRIPSSPKSEKSDNQTRPVAFLQHGFISSSDCWILNGPDNALAYLFADAGFDVWMGNSRGNTYSRKNVNISSDDSEFWQFSFEELATRDLPAMIDYILEETNQDQLHYVGHSQGTTIFFVLMSEIPNYNSKIKTAHMLAPVAFMEHAQLPFGFIGGSLLGHPSILTELYEDRLFGPLNEQIVNFRSVACADGSRIQFTCAYLLFATGGWDPHHLNYTLLPQVFETHPAGISTNQIIHFYQEYVSGQFRKYDYGEEENIEVYGQVSPPDYRIENVVAPVRTYYGNNDFFAAAVDVKHLEGLLPNLVESYNVPVDKWNHYDFLWALDVKEQVNDKVIGAAISFEKTGRQQK